MGVGNGFGMPLALKKACQNGESGGSLVTCKNQSTVSVLYTVAIWAHSVNTANPQDRQEQLDHLDPGVAHLDSSTPFTVEDLGRRLDIVRFVPIDQRLEELPTLITDW